MDIRFLSKPKNKNKTRKKIVKTTRMYKREINLQRNYYILYVHNILNNLC